MSSLITQAHATTRSPQSSISLILDSGSAAWIGVIYIRTEDGVFFLKSTFGPKRPDLDMIYLNSLSRGRYSPRPYRLGQEVDESVHNCVFALFHDLCLVRGLKAQGIARIAYPHSANQYSAENFREIVAQAEWEGYAAPDRWDALSITLLYKTLDAIGHSPIREILESVLALPEP